MRQEPVTITLLGKPVPGSRARSKYRWIPKNQAQAMDQLKLAASETMQGRAMLEGPLALSMVAELPIPSSWSRKKQHAAVLCEVLPVMKPDLKNLLWLVEDALTSVVYRDDAQVVAYDRVAKRYAVQPKIVVTVRPAARAGGGSA